MINLTTLSKKQKNDAVLTTLALIVTLGHEKTLNVPKSIHEMTELVHNMDLAENFMNYIIKEKLATPDELEEVVLKVRKSYVDSLKPIHYN